MVIFENDNTSLELSVSGYQYPEIKNEEYDSDWLYISLKLIDDGKVWKSVDPALLTWELREISEWFRDLSNDSLPRNIIEFIEPCITFEYQINNDLKTIRICISYEMKPDFVNSNIDKYCVTFDLDNEDLYKISKEFEEELSKYPVRVEPEISRKIKGFINKIISKK